MILMEWMLMLLLTGISVTDTADSSDRGRRGAACPGLYEKCMDGLFELMPQALISKELRVSDDMRKDIIDCMQNDYKRCNLLGFVDLYGSTEENSCDAFKGCPEKEDELPGDKTKENSFLHCMDDHMPDMVKCLGNSMIRTTQYFVTLARDHDDKEYLCRLMWYYVPCAREVSIKKCGKDGSDLVIKEFKREYKGMLESCEEISETK